MDNRIIVQAPGMSKAVLADLLGGIRFRDDRIRVADAPPESRLNADPATVALITTVATVATSELVKAAVAAFVEWVKGRKRTSSSAGGVNVTLVLTLGGRRTATITDVSDLEAALGGLPSDPAEIPSLILREAP
jgi:hypothetical protein